MKLSARFASVFLALFLAPGLALAHDHGPRGAGAGYHGDHEQHMERMAERLGLSEAQRQEWAALHETHHPHMQALRNEMRAQRNALREAATAEGLDERAAEAAAERLGELTREASLMRARMRAEVLQMLTEEQRGMFGQHYQQKGEGPHRGMKRKDGARS
jgi:periplasmic protein CpxP/Spy